MSINKWLLKIVGMLGPRPFTWGRLETRPLPTGVTTEILVTLGQTYMDVNRDPKKLEDTCRWTLPLMMGPSFTFTFILCARWRIRQWASLHECYYGKSGCYRPTG